MDGPKNPRRFKKNKRRFPSLEKIENGVFLDFEGYGRNTHNTPLPAMCGYRVGGDGPVVQVVFSKNYSAAAQGSKLEFCERGDFFKWFLNDLTKGRSLFAYSEHEEKMIRRISGRKKPLKKYENVLTITKKALRDMNMLPEDCSNSLIEYCELTGITVPGEYGKGQVTAWLDSVKQYSTSRKKWASVTKEARRHWELLLNHNRFDVECMYELLLRIK